MPDIQKTEPKIQIAIQRVGITGLKLPVYIKEKDGGKQHTVADIDIFVDLAAESKGTHMSRLAIGLQKFMNLQLDQRLLDDITEYVRSKCEAQTCQVIYRFPYFIQRVAPVSKEPGLIYCNVEFDLTKELVDPCVTSHMTDEQCYNTQFIMSVTATTTSLCPCSKEISDGGAHNQRSKIKIKVHPKVNELVWIEDIVNIAEENSSCQVYSTLKRPDEKYVTEKAYANPNFVEDMVRHIYDSLDNFEPINTFVVEVSNEESIHQHNAYAKMMCGME